MSSATASASRVSVVQDLRRVRVFVARDGNAFMRDIAEWVAEAARELGRDARVVDDRMPGADGSINLVVAPHEFYALCVESDSAIRAAARCSIPVCTEQPGTPWFNLAFAFCVESEMVIDINAAGCAEFKRRGVVAERLQLGGVGSMDRAADKLSRDIDVLFLGGYTDRRAALLAQLAPLLFERHAEIRMFSFSRPLTGAEPGVVFGTQKYDLLARSKILINLHRSDESNGYFEWARLVETMANGCVVLTEPSVDHRPLVAGEHFVEASLDGLPTALTALLKDGHWRAEIAASARAAVLDAWPLSKNLAPILERLDSIVTAGRTGGGLGRKPSIRYRRLERAHRPPLLPEFRPHEKLRREIYRALIAEMHHRRSIDRVRCMLHHGAERHIEVIDSTSWSTADPEVSVIVTLYDYAAVVGDTLDSIVGTTDVDFEIVVVDDHSTDEGREVVRRFVAGHPELAVRLVGSDVNVGLPAARNLAIENSRSDKIMVMDADNMIYPTCLRRLADALDDDPEASFAYATLEVFGAERGLASARGWFVPWLCDSNYIDAQAMVRRSTLLRHCGYRSDDDVHGWEDWDLWLRLAAAGEYGVHLPQILGRYRAQARSMISITNLVAQDLRNGLIERYPTLPWPELA